MFKRLADRREHKAPVLSCTGATHAMQGCVPAAELHGGQGAEAPWRATWTALNPNCSAVVDA